MAPGSAAAEILQATINHARENSEFYKARIPADFNLLRGASLADIPIMERRDLIALSDEVLLGRKIPHLVGLTSGTSYASGDPSFLFRLYGPTEQSASKELYTRLSTDADNVRVPMTLRFVNANHGLDFYGAQDGIFSLPLEIDYHFQAAVALCKRHFSFAGFSDRIERLIGMLNTLKAFTKKSVESDIDVTEFGIDSIVTMAWRLTPYWRGCLSEYWRVPIFDTYAISEVPGLSGYRCHHCDAFHFLSSAYVEFVPIAHSEFHQTPRRLIATSYYPLSELMPIIRYNTGDVFIPNGHCRHADAEGYTFLGRERHLKRTGAGHWISTGMIVDVLEYFQDVRRYPDPRAINLGVKSEIGLPMFEYNIDDERLSVRATLHNSAFSNTRMLEDKIAGSLTSKLNFELPVEVTCTVDEPPSPPHKL